MVAKPFVPFALVMADGREYRVPSPEWILYPEPKRMCTVYIGDDRRVSLDLLTMTSIEYDERNHPKSPIDEEEAAA